MDFTDKINATNSKNSFMLHNGIRLTQMEKDYARVEADLTRVNRNLYGAVHGGMFLTMGDCAEGRIKSRGRTICVAEVEIHDGLGKLLCSGTFTLFCTGKLDELPED